MTLQSSGAISFGDINVELGLARTTTRALGSAAARALAGVASGAIRTAADFYGKSNYLDRQTITVGLYTTKGGAFYGYFPSAATGSISDGTFDVKLGATINGFYWTLSTTELIFRLTGSHTNDGWTNLQTVSSQGTTLNFTRASSTYTNSGSDTTWKWTTSTNPFPHQADPLLTAVCTFT